MTSEEPTVRRAEETPVGTHLEHLLAFPKDPRRVLLVGDSHGNARFLEAMFRVARAQDCHVIVQLGDFGLWPSDQAFLAEVSTLARRYRVPTAFIDGNHDWHEARLKLCADHGYSDPIPLREGLYYLPRGCRWTWSGVRFGALGGAFSVDHHFRVLNVSWWREEVIAPDDVERLGSEPLDVLLTHDAPLGAPLFSGWNLPPSDQAKADANQALVTEAMRRTRPKLVVHGHWHWRASYEMAVPSQPDGHEPPWVVRVEGLAHDEADDSGQAWATLDLPGLAFKDGRREPSSDEPS